MSLTAPTFKFIQGTSLWTSGAVAEFSSTPSSGYSIHSLEGNINLSASPYATGYQSSNAWSETYKVSIPGRSYEFICGLRVVTPASSGISNLRVYIPSFTPMQGVTFYIGTIPSSAFTSPVGTVSTIATTNFTSISSSGSALNVGVPENLAGALSHPIYIQMQVDSTASPGPIQIPDIPLKFMVDYNT